MEGCFSDIILKYMKLWALSDPHLAFGVP
ncbi:MAG: hypothetical protein K940chlam2_01287, partial [Chlamydiae bacterium]|nr:hypothetical protein [Chlamydiota bacterium]